MFSSPMLKDDDAYILTSDAPKRELLAGYNFVQSKGIRKEILQFLYRPVSRCKKKPVTREGCNAVTL